MELVVGGLIGAVLSVVATAIFLPMLQDPITDFLATRLSNPFGLRKSSSLSGTWQQDWQIDGRSQITHPAPRLHLEQFGKSLVGEFTFDGRPYRLRARIENSTYISGIWFDQAAGQTYHGTFQARIEVDQKRVEGKWIGFSKTLSSFNTGTWVWSRGA
jgi:hypothetical protein